MNKNVNRSQSLICVVVCVFVLLFSCVLNFLDDNYNIALTELLVSSLAIIYIILFSKNRKKEIKKLVSIVENGEGNISTNAISAIPKPLFILNIDGKVVWYNDIAIETFKMSDMYGISLPELLPELKWTEVLKKTDKFEYDVKYEDRFFKLYGTIIIRKEENSSKKTYSVIIYMDEVTENVNLKKTYENEKVDVALIVIDNYDDVFQSMDDNKSQETLAKVNSVISKWVSESSGVMKKINSDRYLIFFEHQYLNKYIENKFDVLEKVRQIGDEIKEPVSVSIGVGVGAHPSENEANARNAVEMVWGRGGDQVAVKTSDGQFKFYGSASKDYEKSTRVKTRMFATSLKEMIKASDKVIFIGHNNADYDSLGAAIGLSRAVKLFDKEPYIILDNSPAVEPLYDELMRNADYAQMIITPSNAVEMVDSETLVIVLDTHRPSMLPAAEILNVANKIVLIDHHRRSTEFIENLSLSYLEPYASSTCEMVTEILQYIDDKKQLNSFEAKALYMGIYMDSKNFVTKTGIRTFEAASYLKRYGINTMEVKKFFNLNFEEYLKRVEIIKKAEIWNGDIAVSLCNETYSNMRVFSAQAADEMLNISGIKAAFVAYENENNVNFSARSYGDINVQLIMEKMGGGGHMTVAGCQIKNVDIEQARELLKNAIREYIEENKQ